MADSEKNLTKDMGDQPHVVQFPVEMEISEAQSLYEYLVDMLNNAGAIELDASQVERIDGAMLQLLAAFVKSVNHDQLHWSPRPSDEFLKSASVVGLTNHLAV